MFSNARARRPSETRLDRRWEKYPAAAFLCSVGSGRGGLDLIAKIFTKNGDGVL